MADLGVLLLVDRVPWPSSARTGLRPLGGPVVLEIETYQAAKSIPFWRTRLPIEWGNTTGTISGAITENDVPVPRCKVRLYYRPNGMLISLGTADAEGLFSFYGLESADSGNYFAVAFDPDSGIQYNALIFDRLTSVG